MVDATVETGGWLDVLRANGVRKDFAYGRWLGMRYRVFANLVWFNGNDFQQWRPPANDAAALAVARGIRSMDSRHLQTIELDAPTSGSRDDAAWTSIIGLDAAYSYYPTYAQVLKEYARPDPVPTLNRRGELRLRFTVHEQGKDRLHASRAQRVGGRRPGTGPDRKVRSLRANRP